MNLVINDDLAGILQRKAQELDLPFEEVVNTVLRKELAEYFVDMPAKIMVRPHDFGAIKADLDLNRTVDELAVEDYQRLVSKNGSV